MNKKQSDCDFYYNKDKWFVDLRICTIISCAIYCTFVGYFTTVFKLLWVFGAFLLSVLIWRGGRSIQQFSMKLHKKSKVSYSSDKSIKEYIKITQTLEALIGGLIVAALFFAASSGIREIYYDTVRHETVAHAKGYIYEIVSALVGFFATYLSALSWFLPDEILYTRNTTVISFVIPVVMALIPAMMFGMPVYVSAIYLITYLVLTYIRYATIRSYERKVKRQKRDEDDRNDKDRWG